MAEMDCNIVGTMEKWQVEKQKLFWIQANPENAYFNGFQYLQTDRSLPNAIFHALLQSRWPNPNEIFLRSPTARGVRGNLPTKFLPN